MVPSHLRWLEIEAPDVLPAAARAHRLLLWGWLPLLALVSIGVWLGMRDAPLGADPMFLTGVLLLVVWLVVFLPPAILGLPVALKAGRAASRDARSPPSRSRLRTMAVLHAMLVVIAAVALVPGFTLMFRALRRILGVG